MKTILHSFIIKFIFNYFETMDLLLHFASSTIIFDRKLGYQLFVNVSATVQLSNIVFADFLTQLVC